MKGAPGVIVAAMLGLLAVALNWLYLQNKVAQVENVSFLGVRDDTKIEIGQPFKEYDFVEVKIPKNNARGLEHFVYLYKDLNLILGTHATRTYQGGELVLWADYRTPPSEIKLDRGKKEMLMWVNVDTSSFVSEHVDPGDKITFLIPKMHTPTPASRANLDGAESGGAASIPTVTKPVDSEAIGPFTVATIGNRMGSFNVTRANQNVATASNVIGIVVANRGTEDEPKLDEKAGRLAALIDANPSLRARVLLHKMLPKN